LTHNQPFLNRSHLRRMMRDLVDGAVSILVVNGPPGSGKSYTTEFVRLVAEQTGVQMAHVARVAEHAPGGADTLARDILAQMGANSALQRQDTVTPVRPRMLARAILTAAQRSGSRWWWVLDGFGRPGVDPEALDLVMELAHQVAEPGPSQHGLVLLDFPHELPVETRLSSVTETLAYLSESDVRVYLINLAGHQGSSLDGRRIDGLVDVVMKDLADEPSRSAEIARRVSAVQAALSNLNPRPGGTKHSES
jgi:cellulose synthase operon protein C